jgi:hypothetical protein
MSLIVTSALRLEGHPNAPREGFEAVIPREYRSSIAVSSIGRDGSRFREDDSIGSDSVAKRATSARPEARAMSIEAASGRRAATRNAAYSSAGHARAVDRESGYNVGLTLVANHSA